jgi:hypothetical protein
VATFDAVDADQTEPPCQHRFCFLSSVLNNGIVVSNGVGWAGMLSEVEAVPADFGLSAGAACTEPDHACTAQHSTALHHVTR